MTEKTFEYHVEKAKYFLEQADDTNPRLANMALKATVYNLVQALDKIRGFDTTAREG